MNYEIKLDAAIELAQAAANAYALPQTVFRTADTCGWANTQPFASFLPKAEVFVTVLPARYFA